jgi:hypothetical protein
MLAKILAAVFLLTANACVACKCEIPAIYPPSAGAELTEKQVRMQQTAWYSQRASSIVRATVLQQASSISSIKSERIDTDQFTRKYKILITEMLKGSDAIGERIISVSKDSCGISVNQNEEWVFFLNGDQPLHQCSGHLHLKKRSEPSFLRWLLGDPNETAERTPRMLEDLREAKTQEQLHRKNPTSRASTMPSNK